MSGQLNVAIVGCGRIAQRHAEHIRKVGKLIAVCDIDRARANDFSVKNEAACYYSLADLLENEKNLDLVSVCTPNGLHAKHSIDSLKAGNNVLCEKPMAITTYDCGEMIKTAEQSNRRLFIVKQNRFNPPVVKVKELLDEGVLGKIFNIQLNCFWNRNEDYYASTWRGSLDMDGGTLFTQFSHFIDLLYWLIGDIEEIKVAGNNFTHKGIIEFEDTGNVLLKFFNGAIGTINYTVNAYDQNMEGSLAIFAENGTLKIGGQYLNELEYYKIKGIDEINLPEGNKANNYGYYKGSMSNHLQTYENVADVLTKGGTISTNSFEGLKTVEIIERIYKKLRK